MNKVLNLAENLRNLRLDNNLSQSALAKKLNFSKQTWSNYECGKYEPDLNTLIKVSKIFNCSIDFLLLNNSRYERNLEAKSNTSVNDAISNLEKLVPKIKFENRRYQKEIENLNISIAKNLKEIDNYNLLIKKNDSEIKHIEKVLREAKQNNNIIKFKKITLKYNTKAYEITLKPPLEENKNYSLSSINDTSMNKIVLDNQLFIIEKTKDVKNGDLVLLNINNTCTILRQYFLIKDKNYIILSPQSTEQLQPQIVYLDETDIKIEGVFIDI